MGGQWLNEPQPPFNTNGMIREIISLYFNATRANLKRLKDKKVKELYILELFLASPDVGMHCTGRKIPHGGHSVFRITTHALNYYPLS